MATQNVVPAYRSAGVTNPSAQVETTTARAAILKQIGVLQKQEAALGEELAKMGNGPETAQARVAIEQKMKSIEDQIKALQMALLQKNADRRVQVPSDKQADKQTDKQTGHQSTNQVDQPPVRPVESPAGTGDAAARAAGAAPAATPRASVSGVDGAVLGGVIDTTA